MFVVWDIRSGIQPLGTLQISDTTIILQPKGHHYRDFLNFRFEMLLGTLKLGPLSRFFHCVDICAGVPPLGTLKLVAIP